MKKIYSTILLVVLTLLNFSTYAQVIEDETGEFLAKEDFLIEIGDKINPPCCNEETPDLSFSFSTGIGLLNHDIIELAREQALNAWFDRQYNLMKNEISNRFDKPYPNFEQARNDYFKNWEKQNILSKASGVKNKYDSRVSAGLGARENFARNLKLLELREVELNLGNISNTSYDAFNFNSVPIGNITSLSQLNTLRNYEIQTFASNEVGINHNSGVSQFLLIDIINMGSYSNRFNFNYGILNELLSLQINHYNTIGNGLPYHYSWYQLDLMQMYLNNIRNFGPNIPPEVFPRDFGTASFLETYANQNRRGGISIWDSGYEAYLVEQMLHPNETDERAIDAAEYSAELAAEYERQYALENLLGDVSEADLIEFQINEELESDPFKLLEIDCNQIQQWQTLAQHTAPQSVVNKIKGLPSSWTNNFRIQDLENANGSVINMDYWAVNITSLPKKSPTGPRYTADEFLEYFRKNINTFSSGSGTTFEPYCEITSLCAQETALWNSNNH